MDVEGEERDESRSSKAQNTRRRIATKTSLEGNRSDERTVAVTTQEPLDGIREKAMRMQASVRWVQAAVQEEGSVQGELRLTRPRKP